MTALICGVLAATFWASSNLCSARAVRYIPQSSVVAWVTMTGLVITTPFCLSSGVPAALNAANGALLSMAGVSMVIGLTLLYGAFRIGKVALVAPIAATEGAVAAVLSAVTGESLAPLAAGLLVLVVCGVALSAMAPDQNALPHEKRGRAILMASSAAAFFGLGIYLTGRLSGDLPLTWLLMIPRLSGALVLALPLALTRRLRLARPALPLVLATGATEVLGYLALAVGARSSIALTAVLASQVATFTAIGGAVLFKERLARVQLVGISLVIVGVTALAAVSASA